MESGEEKKTEAVDLPLHSVGFQLEEITPHLVSGYLLVTEKCCQPFKVLHGGVSALIAEALASIGAHLACGLQRVAGVHLTINHLKTAVLGDRVHAQATPITLGRTIQVWEVKIWKTNPLSSKDNTLVSTSRVTLLCNMPVPDHAKHSGDGLRKFAKL